MLHFCWASRFYQLGRDFSAGVYLPTLQLMAQIPRMPFSQSAFVAEASHGATHINLLKQQFDLLLPHLTRHCRVAGLRHIV
jgi:hypothetical protein